jgi:nucleotide-binding universal stress UspA family protein
MFHTLIIPLDGTPQSDRVIDLAARVAAPDQSRLHVLCVIDPAYTLSPDDKDGVEPDGLVYPAATEQATRAEQIVTAATGRLQNRGYVAAGSVCSGRPAETIVAEARRIGADVIVMCHRHLTRLQRWSDPSTANAVIELALCPVLIDTGIPSAKRMSPNPSDENEVPYSR